MLKKPIIKHNENKNLTKTPELNKQIIIKKRFNTINLIKIEKKKKKKVGRL